MAGVLHLPAAVVRRSRRACRPVGGAARRGWSGVTLDASDQVWPTPTLDRRTYLNAVVIGYGAAWRRRRR